MMWDGMWGWHWLGGVAMMLMWLLLILLVAVALKYLRSGGGSDGPGRGFGKTAAEYLDEAYAKGEISREEYLRKRSDLERPSAD